jgi:hypothetical protein
MAKDTSAEFDARPVPSKIPNGDVARQATAALRGYTYQLHATVSSWIQLPSDGELYIEVTEDYAELLRAPDSREEILRAVQVKDTRESGSVTLNGTLPSTNPETFDCKPSMTLDVSQAIAA